MSFRARLIISLIILLIPLLASNAYFHYRQYMDNRSAALSQQTEAARDLSRAMQIFVTRTVAIERAVGQAVTLSHWHDPAARAEYLQSVQASVPTLGQLYFVDTSGKTVDRSPSSPSGLDFSDRPYFHRILSGADWAVSDLLVNRTSGKLGFVIATGIRDSDGKLLGMVLAGIDGDRLAEEFRLVVGRASRLLLVDTRGEVAFISGQGDLTFEQRQWGKYPFVQKALHGEDQEVIDFAVSGSTTLDGTMLPIENIGWAAGSFISKEEFVSPIISSAIQDVLLTLLVLMFTFLVGSFIAAQMVSPVEDLSYAAARLGRGKLESRARVPKIMEFATLAGTMNRMAESIQQRDEEIRAAYERERRIASALQKRMLPDVPANIHRLELATGYFPALEEAELGGDFYDVMPLQDRLIGLLIADVSGKGLSAAVHTAMAKYMLEGFASEDPDPASALRRLNLSIRSYLQEWSFISAFFAIINPDTGEMTYANAGHPPPIIRRSGGRTEWLVMPSGPPLGAMESSLYEAHNILLDEGDILVCYTDGVIDVHHGKEWYGMEGLEDLMKGFEGTPRETVDAIYQSVSGFVNGDLPDDIALLVVRVGA